MKTATVRDLRNNFATLEAWMNEGEEIRIEKRGKPIAILTPLPRHGSKGGKKPDFEARRKALWGDRIFTDAEVAEMRAYELEGEQG